MMTESKKIKIVIITGSTRPDNYTSKACALVVDEIRKHPDITLEIIDPTEMKLTLPGSQDKSHEELLQKIVASATGVILSTPEYHGSYSSAIKLVIDNLGFPSVLAGKPIALLGVASGAIGAIKALEHLRSVCSHVGAIVLPGPVSVANVHEHFDANGRCTDEKIEKRIRALATTLIDYIEKNICPRKALEDFVRNQSQ